MYKVELTYFKPSGKYYSSGEYESCLEYLFEIWDEIRFMMSNGTRPGLTDSKQNEFDVLVNVPDHPLAHPHLIRASSIVYK